jgi:hypothetical protein
MRKVEGKGNDYNVLNQVPSSMSGVRNLNSSQDIPFFNFAELPAVISAIVVCSIIINENKKMNKIPFPYERY